MKVDTVLVNGIIVTAHNRFEGTIGIKDGQIAYLTNNKIDIDADELIDVAGKYIIPGAIDAHVHFQDPGATGREDFEHGTKACAVGGITTAISQPVNDPPVFDQEIYNETVQCYAGRGVIDYGLHAGGSSKNIENIESLWSNTGSPALKIMMCYSPESYGMVNDGQLFQIMETLSTHNGLAYVHAENQSLVEMLEKKLRKQGRKDPLSYLASRPSYVETEAVHRALVIAEQTGCRLVIAHVSCAESLEMIAAARSRGLEVFAESCPHFFAFIDKDIEEHGPYLKFSPVMRDRHNFEKMWESLAKGYVHTIGSDHCPYEAEEKKPGEKCIWDAPNGVPGLEVMLPVFLDGVSNGRITLEKLVEVTSYNVARIYDLYPCKGSLLPGSDADIVIIDMELGKTFSREDIKSKCQYSPYLGMALKGWPVMTMVRGTIVAQDGKICVSPGYGKYYSRNSFSSNSYRTF